MTAALELTRERAAVLAERSGGTVSETFDELTVDVPADRWVEAFQVARDELELAFFDWLSAVDEQAEGLSVVCHVADPVSHAHLLVRTRIPADEPSLPTLSGIYRGANWHERETFEMFGVDFVGHPNLVSLLLPEGFEGRPLRKDFVLASRAARPWPGAKEPGESEHEGTPTRRKTMPPGVPDEETWGPRPPSGGAG